MNFNKILVELLNTLFTLSENICVVGGMIGIILFIFGWKKCKNVPFITWAIYIIIQIIGRVMLGV